MNLHDIRIRAYPDRATREWLAIRKHSEGGAMRYGGRYGRNLRATFKPATKTRPNRIVTIIDQQWWANERHTWSANQIRDDLQWQNYERPTRWPDWVVHPELMDNLDWFKNEVTT